MTLKVDLGGLIDALRELFKDLRFRNRQERERGDCELIRLRLDVARDLSAFADEQRLRDGSRQRGWSVHS